MSKNALNLLLMPSQIDMFVAKPLRRQSDNVNGRAIGLRTWYYGFKRNLESKLMLRTKVISGLPYLVYFVVIPFTKASVDA